MSSALESAGNNDGNSGGIESVIYTTDFYSLHTHSRQINPNFNLMFIAVRDDGTAAPKKLLIVGDRYNYGFPRISYKKLDEMYVSVNVIMQMFRVGTLKVMKEVFSNGEYRYIITAYPCNDAQLIAQLLQSRLARTDQTFEWIDFGEEYRKGDSVLQTVFNADGTPRPIPRLEDDDTYIRVNRVYEKYNRAAAAAAVVTPSIQDRRAAALAAAERRFNNNNNQPPPPPPLDDGMKNKRVRGESSDNGASGVVRQRYSNSGWHSRLYVPAQLESDPRDDYCDDKFCMSSDTLVWLPRDPP